MFLSLFWLSSLPILFIHLGEDVDSQIVLHAFEGREVTIYPSGIVWLVKDSFEARVEERPLYGVGEYSALRSFGYWDQAVCRVCLFKRRSEIVQHAQWLCKRHSYFKNEHIKGNLSAFQTDSLGENLVVQKRKSYESRFCSITLKLEYPSPILEKDIFPPIRPRQILWVEFSKIKVGLTLQDADYQKTVRDRIMEGDYLHWSQGMRRGSIIIKVLSTTKPLE